MSEPQSTTPTAPEMDEVTKASLAAVRAWDKEHGRASIPVLVGDNTEDDLIEFTEGGAFLSGMPGDPERVAMVRIGGRRWHGVELSTVTVHPRRGELAAFKAPEHTSLEFPPPQCAYCEIDLEHDGDSWNCPQCLSWWSSDGYSSHRRRCVEDECGGEEADAVGDDGQPRCRSCQFLVVLGVIEATGPYKCSEPYCYHGQVYGMPYNAPARRNRMGTKKRCGGCQQRAESDAYWENRRVSKKANKPVETASPL